jgi:hypothetical protein
VPGCTRDGATTRAGQTLLGRVALKAPLPGPFLSERDFAGLVALPAFRPGRVPRCPVCEEPNIVREDDYVCTLCDARLPRQWNFDQG